MPIPKPVRWIIRIFAGLIALIVIVLAVLSLIQIPIDLEKQKGLIEKIASQAIGTNVNIDDQIQVTTSLWPAFAIKGLRVSNPENFETGDFVRMQSARIEIGVIPLLLGKIHVHDFSVEGLHLFLRADEKGNVNWTFQQSSSPDAVSPDKDGTTPQQDTRQIKSDALVVKRISLNGISVSYLDADMTEPFEFKINECTGSARAGKPLELKMEGSFLREPFTTSLAAASLQELIEQNKSWMEIETNVANAQIRLEGSVDLSRVLHTLQLSASIEGERLESFNGMLELDLPPVQSYRAKATLSLLKDRIDMTDLRIHVAGSELVGKMTVDDSGNRPKADIDLKSPMIQINDFVFDDWSLFEEPSDESMPDAREKRKREERVDRKGTEAIDDSRLEGATMELLSPELLGSFDARLSVSAEKVMSGTDQLGSGSVTGIVEEGRISIDPLLLDLPGGPLSFTLSLKPGMNTSDAALKVKVHNFDIGVPARRVDPQTDMGGTINLDIDLESSANNLAGLLANGKGHLDFSAHPENLRSGIIDLWAVNLVSAIVSRADKGQSQIECLIGRWSMNDGLLKPDVFVIDTSRMRICGKGQVDFKKEEVNLQVAPAPKKPQFFSLATPLGVHGKFSDFKLGIVPGGVAETTVSFIFSPIHVPIRTLAGESIPKDGSDVCGMHLGADNRPTSPPAGCR